MISFVTWGQSAQADPLVSSEACDRQAHLAGGRNDPSQMTLGIRGHSAAFPSGSPSPTVAVSI